MHYLKIVVLTISVLLVPGVVSSADYKDWLPHLPDTLAGLKAASKGEGMNMSTGDGSMSTLKKAYKDGNKEVSIAITHMEDKSKGKVLDEMSKDEFNMETSAMVMKTVNIQGFSAMYQYLKDENSALISVDLNAKGTLILATGGLGAKGEKYNIGLFDKINLKKIYASF